MILQEEMTILSNVAIAPRVFRMVLKGEMVLDMRTPDQFLHIRAPSPDKVLRRPISICEYNRADKTCVIIYRVEGSGLAFVSQMTAGQKLDVMGPLGNGFDLAQPFPNKKALIIGGGIGTPPLLQLARDLAAMSVEVTVLLGFAQKSAVILESDFAATAVDLKIVTDDGSYGRKGNVGMLMDELCDLVKFDAIYACGAIGMLKAVESRTLKHPNAYISMEARMACGMGACYACVVHVADDETAQKSLKVCDDGPIFKVGEVVI
ncbi:dihydroorotate dehydrogenase B (NAD(+)), electron transfer subunit [Lactococcus hodotermopsidis]|uniref:Dihydroorotate dehydrogenase B (NAD(+)), electron transfer subunit n=1 Tax=Pseudolactococcus hodotermopsidis TaxID=2709157 RepID=A0A6A0BA02_9LACT|nr:dihydroorotate dehydrogenase electron transfer subunit [Lactococcus hodotermopsidis]GFH42280.1 dihydroorotate dehydrogenase B (NAD(+)), electron transfer subunit [Lactococcus hodotermopsidis]